MKWVKTRMIKYLCDVTRLDKIKSTMYKRVDLRDALISGTVDMLWLSELVEKIKEKNTKRNNLKCFKNLTPMFHKH